MHHIITEDLMYALGWTVLHSLWQAMIIALLLAVIMVFLQGRQARLRYYLANGSLLLVVALAGYTFMGIYANTPDEIITNLLVNTPAADTTQEVVQSSFLIRFETYFNQNMPLIVVIWLVGMVLFLLRMLGGLAYIQYLKNRFTKEMPEKWQNQLQQLSGKLSLKSEVRLLESALVTVPMVIGWIKPVILIPVGAVNGLTAKEAEAVLAHELAHISRHDFLFNLLQSFVEVILYFNPAIWWISAIIRVERENCCDDIALDLCDDRLAYAKALVSLQEQNTAKVPGIALAFSNSRKQMLNRISRILNHPQNKSKIMEKFAITSLMLLAILAVSMSGYNAPDFVSEKTNETKTEVQVIATSFEIDETGNPAEIKTGKDGNPVQLLLSVSWDTLPQGKNRLIVEREDQKMEVEIEEGAIKALKIDGKEIPEAEFGQHIEEVEELWGIEPEAERHAFWVYPSEGNNFKLHSDNDDGHVKFFFRSEEGEPFVMPDIQLDDDLLFLEKDGKSIYVLPDVDFDFDFVFPENFEKEYKVQMEELKLHLKENEWRNKEEIKKLLHQQRSLNGKISTELNEKLKEVEERNNIIERNYQGRMEGSEAMKKAKKKLGYAKLKYKEDAFINGGVVQSGRGYFIPYGRNNNHSNRFVKRLIADGVIKDVDNYKIELSGKNLKVNGKKQSEVLHKKYLELYESLSGFEMDKKSKIIIRSN